MLERLAVFVLLAALLANAQEPRSCANTRTVFEDVLVLEPGAPSPSDVFPSLQPFAGSQCQLDSTCCPLEVESNFKQSSVLEYQRLFQESKAQLSLCHNHSIFAETYDYFQQSKIELLDTLNRQPLLEQYFNRETVLFDRFYNYLANSVYSGDLTNLQSEFFDAFFTVYLEAYLSNDLTPDYPNTPSFHQCFYDYFLETKGATIDNWLFGFERAYNRTMRYFRALHVVNEVVTAVSRHAISEQCQRSLLRMMHCAHCAGYPASSQSCNGLCVNTMRGCLLDLGDLVEPIREFTQALLVLKDEVVVFNPYLQIGFFNSYFNMIIGDTSNNFYSILLGVQDKCLGGVPPSGRRKREAPDSDSLSAGDIPRPPISGRRKREAPNLSPRQSVPHPLGTLNSSAYCLIENQDFFGNLSESICNEPSVSEDNTQCWNGRSYGDYTRDVVGYSRAEQANNPEMLVCSHLRSQFSREILLLRYMTREMRSFTGTCSTDDEDCPEVPPISVYYNLNAIDLSSVEIVEGTQSPDDVEEVSGSGSQPEDEVCQEPTAIPVTTSSNPVPGGTDTTGMVGVSENIESTSSGRVVLSSMTSLVLACSLVWTVLAGWAWPCSL